MEVARLRDALELYYAKSTNPDEPIITVPKGTYCPQIVYPETGNASDHSTFASESSPLRPKRKRRYFAAGLIAAMSILLCVAAVFGLRSYIGSPEVEGVTIAVQDFEGATEASTLAKDAMLSGLARSSTIEALSTRGPSNASARLLLGGHVTSTDDGFFIFTELTDAETGRVEWTKSVEAKTLQSIPDVVSDNIVRELRVQVYGATKRALSSSNPNDLTALELFVLATWVPTRENSGLNWELDRVRYANLALEKNNELGQAHSVLADKLGYLANVNGPSDSNAVASEILIHVEKAIALEPQDPDVIFNAAQGLWHMGHIERSTLVMKRAVELDPAHDIARFLSDVIPYTCTVPPDYVLQKAVDFDARLANDNPIRWLTQTWIAALHSNREDWEAALESAETAALMFEMPYSVLRHAMLLEKLGRASEAKALIERQRINWPNFDPAHFVDVTIPRLCQESQNTAYFVDLYSGLAQIMNE